MPTQTKRVIYWISPAPTHCDYSGLPITTEFVDGRLPGHSSWGCFDAGMFRRLGGILGQGSGQRYVKQPEGSDDAGRWLKVEG